MRRLTALVLLGTVGSTVHAGAARAAIEAPVGQIVGADSRTARNVLYLELLGNGGFFSFNAERFFARDVSGRIGLGLVPAISIDPGAGAPLMMPLLANYSGIGSLDHKLELGLGMAFQLPRVSIFGTGTVGYRYVPHDGGFTFKIAFTPLLGPRGFLPWLGIGFGYVF